MDNDDLAFSPAENSRHWGEEKEEEAIWDIFLKKVRYQRPSAIVQIVQARGNHAANFLTGGTAPSQEDDDSEIAHLMWETVRVKVLRAGTLKKIVEAIANDDTDVQATHLSVFLATYRAFASPAEVMQEIISIHKEAKDEFISKAMLDLLNVWLDTYPEDFEHGTEGFETLQKSVLPFARENNLKSLLLKTQYKLRSKKKMKKATSLHSLRTNSPYSIKTYAFHSIPESHFAQQLTYIDKELFLNLRVYECLGALWKRRCGSPSVVATVEQFNALSGRVVATVLLDSNASAHQRAKVVDRWIRIAHELRMIKNFSSLKAIVSGLGSNPVFRLQKIWQLISKDKLALFTQLSQIFSEENNRLAQRTLLEVEGTAKFSTPTKSPHEKRFLNRLRGSQSTTKLFPAENEIPNGTIPYLGTFLTDLTFIDVALPDKVNGNLINFDKRKKEFEILAQLKLLQGSAKGYRIEEDPYFSTWFNSLVVLDDKTAYDLSLSIQPEKPSLSKGHRKTDSIASNSSSDNADGLSQRKSSLPSSTESSMLYGATGRSIIGSPHSPSLHESSVVVKVSSPSKSDVMYKSMMVGNSDHTPKVITQALEKLGLQDEDPRQFSLVQILPHKELKFPPNANVFYALDTSVPIGEIRLECRPLFSVNNNNNVSKNPK